MEVMAHVFLKDIHSLELSWTHNDGSSSCVEKDIAWQENFAYFHDIWSFSALTEHDC